ncbi:hypothetical protein H7U12_03845 [Rufibacter sp. H-1]|uniref:Glycosyltransferase family 61 protein n=1 Tax=Rufibacter sediminis TaxID=2762756 RepID=A0ABR6VNP1_9BACT|nr:hypothetical protein [Rufibacter sediminis]
MINKLLSALALLRHREVRKEYRYFIRDTYFCRLVQGKYLLKDYVFRKAYKVVSFNGEFGAELQFVIPFAYWHYRNGTLKKSISSQFTKELYFFSQNHEEKFIERVNRGDPNEGNYNFEMPRILHSHNYDMNKWLAVPFKETYQNNVFVFEKPILIVANRYSMEWGGPPVSFFDKPILSFIFHKLAQEYTIIYNRPLTQHITKDHNEVVELNERRWIQEEHPEVILLEDLYEEKKSYANNFNHLQLLVYANADHFISIHGGTSVLASYFGGTNLILSKSGAEHYFGCFQTLYPKLSGATILHAKSEEEVRHYVEEYFVKNPSEKPVIGNQPHL